MDDKLFGKDDKLLPMDDKFLSKDDRILSMDEKLSAWADSLAAQADRIFWKDNSPATNANSLFPSAGSRWSSADTLLAGDDSPATVVVTPPAPATSPFFVGAKRAPRTGAVQDASRLRRQRGGASVLDCGGHPPLGSVCRQVIFPRAVAV